MTGDLAKPDNCIGKSFPLGATVYSDGVNFSIFSKNATAIDLLLFNTVDDSQPARVIPLDRRSNRTFHFWHVFISGIRPGQLYAYQAHAPAVDGTAYLVQPHSVFLLARYLRL